MPGGCVMSRLDAVYVFLLQVEVERGMSFQQALDKLNLDTYPGEGFYTSKKVRHLAL